MNNISTDDDILRDEYPDISCIWLSARPETSRWLLWSLFSTRNMWSCSDIFFSLCFSTLILYMWKSPSFRCPYGADGKQLHRVHFCFQEIYNLAGKKKPTLLKIVGQSQKEINVECVVWAQHLSYEVKQQGGLRIISSRRRSLAWRKPSEHAVLPDAFIPHVPSVESTRVWRHSHCSKFFSWNHHYLVLHL